MFLLRACDQYDVRICAGEVGSALANAMMAAQMGASTKLRTMGFRQRITQRLAVGCAGPYWGTSDKHALTASDFIQYTDAELDAFASEARQVKASSDQRPAPPTRLDDWVARVQRQNKVWALLYGMEWQEVRENALELLTRWHQEMPHKWPLQILMDVWEELHWRFIEELKELLRLLKTTAKRESMSLSEIRFHALLPGPDGHAWLVLPSTFDLMNPSGWFKAELDATAGAHFVAPDLGRRAQDRHTSCRRRRGAKAGGYQCQAAPWAEAHAGGSEPGPRKGSREQRRCLALLGLPHARRVPSAGVSTRRWSRPCRCNF